MSYIVEGQNFGKFTEKGSDIPTDTINLVLIQADIRSLEGFPTLESLKRLDLSDNRIKDGLDILVKACPNLEVLNLGGNFLKTFESIEPLYQLTNLKSLNLDVCDVCNLDDFSETVFSKIPTLVALNDMTKTGEDACFVDEYACDGEESSDDELCDDEEEGAEERVNLADFYNNEQPDEDEEEFVAGSDEDDDDISDEDDVAEGMDEVTDENVAEETPAAKSEILKEEATEEASA